MLCSFHTVTDDTFCVVFHVLVFMPYSYRRHVPCSLPCCVHSIQLQTHVSCSLPHCVHSIQLQTHVSCSLPCSSVHAIQLQTHLPRSMFLCSFHTVTDDTFPVVLHVLVFIPYSYRRHVSCSPPCSCVHSIQLQTTRSL
jgi:hypothetical protein